MKNIYLLLLFIGLSSSAQKLVVLSESISGADTFFGYDNHGFAYYNSKNAIIKMKDGSSVEYKNVGLGKIERADIINPLKVLVYYSNFNSVVLLDSQLVETLQINFSTLEKPIVVGAVGNASRNKLWIFNEVSREIGLYDYFRGSYSTLTQPILGKIIHYQTDFNTFTWVNDKLEQYTCDIFGKITPLGIVPPFDEIYFIDGSSILLKVNNQISFINALGETKVLIEIDEKTYKSFSYSQQKLAIFTTSGIKNYKIITP